MILIIALVLWVSVGTISNIIIHKREFKSLDFTLKDLVIGAIGSPILTLFCIGYLLGCLLNFLDNVIIMKGK